MERLRRTPDARALLSCEMRRHETCSIALTQLEKHGLDARVFQVCGGRELVEVCPHALAPAESTLLLVAKWSDRELQGHTPLHRCLLPLCLHRS